MRVPRVLGLGCRGIRALGLLGTYRVLVDGSLKFFAVEKTLAFGSDKQPRGKNLAT